MPKEDCTNWLLHDKKCVPKSDWTNEKFFWTHVPESDNIFLAAECLFVNFGALCMGPAALLSDVISIDSRNIKSKSIQVKFLFVEILKTKPVNVETNYVGLSMRKQKNLSINIMKMY